MLAAPLSTVLAACTGGSEPAPPDPDRQQLEAAHAIELALLAEIGNDSAAPADALDAVEQHVAALADALGDPASSDAAGSPSPATGSPSPSPSTPPPGSALRAADRAADAHTRALRSASAQVSPLLASIAASDAAIASALRAVRSGGS